MPCCTQLWAIRRRARAADSSSAIHQPSTPTPGIRVELLQVGHHAGAHGVQVQVAHKFEAIGLFFHHNGLESVLKDVATAAVASIEGDGIAGQELAQQCREPGRAAAQEQVGVIGQETPGVNGRTGRQLSFIAWSPPGNV